MTIAFDAAKPAAADAPQEKAKPKVNMTRRDEMFFAAEKVQGGKSTWQKLVGGTVDALRPLTKALHSTVQPMLDAVIDFCAAELQRRFARALDGAPDGFERVERIVRTAFRLAARHPSMVGLMREVNRIGPPTSTRLTAAVTPLLEAAAGWLQVEMDAGRLRTHDPKLLVLVAYSSVTGLATEVEVLRAMGEEPTLASLVRRRDQLIRLLKDALVT